MIFQLVYDRSNLFIREKDQHAHMHVQSLLRTFSVLQNRKLETPLVSMVMQKKKHENIVVREKQCSKILFSDVYSAFQIKHLVSNWQQPNY